MRPECRVYIRYDAYFFWGVFSPGCVKFEYNDFPVDIQ